MAHSSTTVSVFTSAGHGPHASPSSATAIGVTTEHVRPTIADSTAARLRFITAPISSRFENEEHSSACPRGVVKHLSSVRA